MSRNMRPQDGGQLSMASVDKRYKRPKANKGSDLLTHDENESVFRMLGHESQTLNTAVVQIYKTEASAHSHWKKKYTGVVCLVKDWEIRSYFLRAYCLIKHELIWEHELYDTMKINKARPFLLTFEGQDGHIGLNFVSEDECDSFYCAVDEVIETRNRKRLERRVKRKSQMAPSAPLAPLPKEPENNKVELRKHPKIGTINITPAPPPAATQQHSKSNLFSLSSSSSNSKNKKPKVNKCDIGAPTDFRHVSHVGWDDNKGFDCQGNENDEMISEFLAKAGVSKDHMNNRDTRAFIYDFIQNKNVLDVVKQENVGKSVKATATTTTTTATTPVAAPPPPPTRHQHHNQNGNASSQRSAPPPPARQPPPPVPTTVPGLSRAPAPPSRPPPILTAPPPPPVPSMSAPPPPPPPPAASAAPPPPPPPPPMAGAGEIPTITTTHAPSEHKAPSSLPAVPDTRNELMECIRKGVNLKKVDTSTLSTGSGDSHSDLMSEIRMGFELRPAQHREMPTNRSSDEVTGTDALADALRRALQERGRVMQSSDDESESSGNDDEWND